MLFVVNILRHSSGKALKRLKSRKYVQLVRGLNIMVPCSIIEFSPCVIEVSNSYNSKINQTTVIN